MIQFDIQEIKSFIGEIQTSPEELFDDDDGRIAQKTGIDTLHRSQKSAYELAIEAVNRLESLDDIKDDIAYLIYVTQSATYFLPNHASLEFRKNVELPLRLCVLMSTKVVLDSFRHYS